MSSSNPNVQRTLLAYSHSPNILPIPATCERDKTIFLTNTGTLYIFWDNRHESRTWIQSVLPTLFPTQWTQDKLQVFYDSYKSHLKWLEFDTGKHILTHCEIISPP